MLIRGRVSSQGCKKQSSRKILKESRSIRLDNSLQYLETKRKVKTRNGSLRLIEMKIKVKI